MKTATFLPAAGAVLIAVAGGAAGTPVPVRVETMQRQQIELDPSVSTVAPTGQKLLSPTARWGKMAAMVAGALWEARSDGNPVGLAASQLAYGVAAALDAPGAPAPAISDNELGGVVFFWKGRAREIQIEIDSDGSHFVRIKGPDGLVSFTDEGFGAVPVDPVNAALRAWADERSRGTVVWAPRA